MQRLREIYVIVVWIILGILVKFDNPNIVLMGGYDGVEGSHRCDGYECGDWITMNTLYCSRSEVYRRMSSYMYNLTYDSMA